MLNYFNTGVSFFRVGLSLEKSGIGMRFLGGKIGSGGRGNVL